MSRFFHPPPESGWAESEIRSFVRSEFFSVRNRFLDRLACAQVFDPELFEALLLWLDALEGCYLAAELPVPISDLAQYDSITAYLKQEATHSHDQRFECAVAHRRWLAAIQRFHLPDA